jgi:uncharacterized protein YggU (UPF0235/DUF167 family)
VLAAAGGSVLRLHVRPRASRPGLAGLHGGALALRVGARPVGEAANREVLTLLAGALGVAASALEIVAGSHGREKRVRVRGLAPVVVRTRLAPLLQFDRAETRD